MAKGRRGHQTKFVTSEKRRAQVAAAKARHRELKQTRKDRIRRLAAENDRRRKDVASQNAARQRKIVRLQHELGIDGAPDCASAPPLAIEPAQQLVTEPEQQGGSHRPRRSPGKVIRAFVTHHW